MENADQKRKRGKTRSIKPEVNKLTIVHLTKMRILSFLIATAFLFLSPLHSRVQTLIKSGESIVLLGDSITQFGAMSPGGYVRLVESGLAAQHINVTVIPPGLSANKSNDMPARLDKDVLSRMPNVYSTTLRRQYQPDAETARPAPSFPLSPRSREPSPTAQEYFQSCFSG